MPKSAIEARWKEVLPGPLYTLRDPLFVCAYGLLFFALHQAARPWGGEGFFSLWYPPAGLRYAALWIQGVRFSPWLIIAELVVGFKYIGGPNWFYEIISMIRPGLCCCLAMWLVSKMAKGRDDAFSVPPMMLGVSAVLAPLLNATAFFLLILALPEFAGVFGITIDIMISLTGLAVGDLLGILVIGPLILWVVEGIQRGRFTFPKVPKIRQFIEDTLVISACVILTIALWEAGTGPQPAPGLLAGAWIGLRHGRIGAWFAIFASLMAFLPHSAYDFDDKLRLELHLAITAVALVTWLSGSFADAQKTVYVKLNRRNRLLYQAERLKTLRAMSVAVIHEISQPLSTLAIEAGHLRHATKSLDPDISESAELVDRKARALSDMVRRLRRFGGRDLDEPSRVPVHMVVQSAMQIVLPELRTSGGKIDCGAIDPDLAIQAQEIEITQALVNLLRNALIFSPGSTITLDVQQVSHEVRISVANPMSKAGTDKDEQLEKSSGMGIGLVIVRTIVEAHGGTLVRQDTKGRTYFILNLPVVSGS